MPATRVFVVYASIGDEWGTKVAQQLINDLQAKGATVVTNDDTIPDEQFAAYLDQELPRCQYVILVQTPPALKSSRVQTTIDVALNLVALQQMKGVLCMAAAPLKSEGEQSRWTILPTFDASQDYPRARDRILLELGLLEYDEEDMSTLVDQHSLSSPASSSLLFLASSSPGTPDKQQTIQTPASAPLDRPIPISRGRRSLPLWMLLVSGALILALVLTFGVVAILAKYNGAIPPTKQGSTTPISQDSVSSANTDGVTDTTLSWMHTTGPGNNMILLVGVSVYLDNTHTVSSITYSGQALTKIGSAECFTTLTRGEPSCEGELWFLTSPPSGKHAITVTLTGSAEMAAGAATFSHVNQANPVGISSTNVGSYDGSTLLQQPSLLVNSTSTKQVIVDTVTQDSSNHDLIVDSRQTQLWSQPYYNNKGGSKQNAASSKPAGASGTTMNWSLGWGDWVDIGVPLNPSSD